MRLCPLDALDATGAKGVILPDGRDVVVAQEAEGVRAYVNACPHQGVPLETFPDRFFDAERRVLVCSAHGARFRPGDGLCVAGPCAGKRLTPFRVAIEDGWVIARE